MSQDDNKLKIWRVEGPDFKLISQHDAGKFVTDVAWCRSIGIQQDLIATSAENNQVTIWSGAGNDQVA